MGQLHPLLLKTLLKTKYDKTGHKPKNFLTKEFRIAKPLLIIRPQQKEDSENLQG
jgi:hypothetical protein